jgi:hypothetical protein
MTTPTDAAATRRGILMAGLAIAGATGVTQVARAQDAKIPQEQVQYQQTPKDGNKCSACVNWVDPNACKIVAGTINPNGWCIAFAPKEG